MIIIHQTQNGGNFLVQRFPPKNPLFTEYLNWNETILSDPDNSSPGSAKNESAQHDSA